jgi:hypothetical protein
MIDLVLTEGDRNLQNPHPLAWVIGIILALVGKG